MYTVNECHVCAGYLKPFITLLLGGRNVRYETKMGQIGIKLYTYYGIFQNHIINHREKKNRYYLSSAICVCGCVCLCVCVYVFAITATPFNLELSNFGVTFLMRISKNGFLKFLKNCFFPELLPFFYISLRFLCNFEEQLHKKQWRQE